jgi:hypothetical protein
VCKQTFWAHSAIENPLISYVCLFTNHKSAKNFLTPVGNTAKKSEDEEVTTLHRKVPKQISPLKIVQKEVSFTRISLVQRRIIAF